MSTSKYKTAFLIPVRPRKGTENWLDVITFLNNTLSSLVNQSDNRFHAIIVSTDPLNLQSFYDDRFEWHTLSDIPPKPEDVLAGDHDKSWKIKYAGYLAEKKAPSHYFLLDADDLMHKDLNRTILDHKQGLTVFNLGYEYHIGIKRAISSTQLSQICGSTIAFSCLDFPLPKEYNWESIQHCQALRLSHDQVTDYCKTHGISINYNQKPSVIYMRGVSFSITFRKGFIPKFKILIKFLLYGKTLTPHEQRQFKLLE